MKNILSWIMLFFSIILFAQNFTVKGKVTDFHNETRISNAQVFLDTYTTYTNTKGEFVFYNIPKGNYLLKVLHEDCDDFSEQISVEKHLVLAIKIEHHAKEIETVNLKLPHKNTGSTVQKTLDKSALERNTTENLGNLLQNVSGVSTLKTGNNIAKPVIHGLYGSRIAVLTNGVRLAEQEWGVEHAPNVDLQNADHVDVVKGASSLKYGGDAIGGVVVLEPEVFRKIDTLKGKVLLSGISNGKGIDFGLNVVKTWQNSWAIKVSGGYKKSGDLQTKNYGLMNTGFDFNSFAFTVQKNEFKQGFEAQYTITNQEIGILRGSHTGNLTDFLNAFNADAPIYQRDFSYAIDNPKQEIQHHVFKLSSYKRFENLGKISATYSWQNNHRQEFDIRRGDLAGIPSVDLSLITNQFTLNHLLERGKWTWDSGIDASYQNNYSNPETKARRLIPNYNKYSVGVYSVFKYEFSKKLQTEAGLRYDHNFYDVVKWFDESDWLQNYADYFPQFFVENVEGRIKTKPQLKFNNISYNAGLEYKPTEKFNIKLNYAQNSRIPNIAELFAGGLHHSASVIEQGNMRLTIEKAHQVNLLVEADFKILEGLHLSFNPYYLYSKNFINQIPTGVQNTIRGVFPVWSYQQIEAKIMGLDADLNLKINQNFTLKSFGNYIYGQDVTHQEPLILMAPARIVNHLEYKNLSFRNFYFSLENEMVFRQNRYPIHNADVTDYINGVEVTKTVDLSSTPNKYQLWKVQTGIEISKNFGAELTVSNLFNTDYRDYLNRLRFFAGEMGRNFIVTFKYNF